MSDLSVVKQISLYSKKGSSDKVYQLQISAVEGGYNLIYANAKRGQTLNPKVKNPDPISLEEAIKEFDKIVKSKKNGSSKYQESEDGGSTLLPSDNATKTSGVDPQLLNSIDRTEAIRLCKDNAWVAQEKFDGQRRPIQVKDGKIEGINKKGDYIGLIGEISNGIDASINMVVDTEDLKTHAAAFDLLEYDGEDLRQHGFMVRYRRLCAIAAKNSSLKVSDVAVTTSEKLELLQRLEDEGREGIVFKRLDSLYTAGRPSSGGDQLKFKFYTEACVVVIKKNAKQSVQIAVLDATNKLVPVGNVTIPTNKTMPSCGDIIEVRYLYAYVGGSLYQPTFEKTRNDVDLSECLQSLLKYRSEPA
jgi:bifunctional non-homologous end joining protein LigD